MLLKWDTKASMIEKWLWRIEKYKGFWNSWNHGEGEKPPPPATIIIQLNGEATIVLTLVQKREWGVTNKHLSCLSCMDYISWWPNSWFFFSKEFLLINPSGLIEDLHFVTPYEVMDLKQQSSTSAKITRWEVDVLTWGTSLIHLDISRKRHPDILSSRCGTITSRKHHLQSML